MVIIGSISFNKQMFKKGIMIEKYEALELIRTEYNRLDEICRVDTSNIEISLSSRMTRQLGCFMYKRSGLSEKLQIKISDKLLNNSDLFYDVIRHEYAHAVVHIRHPHRRHVHDDTWKAVCKEVGCVPKATQKTDEPYVPAKSRPDKYIVRCNSCGAESRYKQASTVVKILMRKKRGEVICKRCHHRDFSLKKL